MKSLIYQILTRYCLLFSLFLLIGGLLQFVVIDYSVKDAIISFEEKDIIEEEQDVIIQKESEEEFEKEVIALLYIHDEVVPVYHEVNAQTLLKGAAHNTNSAYPNRVGNSVLFGHRDSVFNVLQEVEKNDILKMKTKNQDYSYKVIELAILDVNDPQIFENSEQTMISLVTCYPFSIYGPSPQRYLVRAIKI